MVRFEGFGRTGEPEMSAWGFALCEDRLYAEGS